jgi:hypothetical protein
MTVRPRFGEFDNTIQAYSGHQFFFSEGKPLQPHCAIYLHEMAFNSGMDKYQVPNHLGK